MVDAGMTPMDTTLAATRNPAELIGASKDIGSVQPGHFADIIAVTGNPLKDIRELKRVQFVMKGMIYKSYGKDTGAGGIIDVGGH
jgi:imidazolonepropionase-like amidohydrolase